MRFGSGDEFINWPAKAVTVFGMSGSGKTTLGSLLRRRSWFHYSVDYRIGTRYMGDYIVDIFKKDAMKNPRLRRLLMSDSIYIRSNITFENLEPLSTYLGKPGDPAKDGLPIAEYRRRQAQHRSAEIAALLDVPEFIERAREVYGYVHFLCDSGGSLCEVVDPKNPEDPVLATLSENTLMLHIRGGASHAQTLIERFRANPKPMYYQDDFIVRKWAEYKTLRDIKDDTAVDPDDFVVWGFEQLIYHRIPLYEEIAAKFGYTVEADDISSLREEEDFVNLVARAIDARESRDRTSRLA